MPAGKVVKLVFDDFHIDTDAPSCTSSSNHKDYVQIRDGGSIESEKLDVVCGDMVEPFLQLFIPLEGTCG